MPPRPISCPPRPAAGRAQPVADHVAEHPQLLAGGRIVAQELVGGAHRAQGQARHRDDPPAPNLAELQARAAQIRHQRVAEREARARGGHAQPRLVAGAQDADLDALVAPQGIEEALAVERVPHRRGRDGDDARSLATLRRVTREEAVHRPEGLGDGARGQRAGGPAAEPGGHALLDHDVVAGARPDARDDEAHRGGAQVHDRDEIRARAALRASGHDGREATRRRASAGFAA